MLLIVFYLQCQNNRRTSMLFILKNRHSYEPQKGIQLLKIKRHKQKKRISQTYINLFLHLTYTHIYACVYTHIYVYAYIYMCVFLSVFLCVQSYERVYKYTNTCSYVCNSFFHHFYTGKIIYNG